MYKYYVRNKIYLLDIVIEVERKCRQMYVLSFFNWRRESIQWEFCANNKLGRLQPQPIGQRTRKLLVM